MRPRATSLGLALLVAWLWLPWSAGAAGEPDPAPAPSDVAELMARFARSGGVRARFHERKQLALLQAPLETEGTLWFAPPDRLARVTTRPGRSSVVVRGERVAIRDETGHQLVDLGASGFARDFVDNLAIVLRGDLSALRERYAVDFSSDGERWQLALEPRSPAIRRLVESIRFRGQGDRVARMQLDEANGDRAVTDFFEVETGLEYSSEELERIFSLEDPGGDS